MRPTPLSRLPKPLLAGAGLLAACAAFACLNLLLRWLGFETGSSVSAPISVFELGDPLDGLIWLLPYALCAGALAYRAPRLRLGECLALSVALVVTGNLMQGGLERAFIHPFVESGFQYYHDALKIEDPWRWARDFNDAQAGLYRHSRTHPPGAVLLHVFGLRLGGGVMALALAFTLLAALAIPLLHLVCRRIGIAPERAAGVAGLFAVTPAFNVYSLVSLDGVIALAATIALAGIVLVRSGRTAAGTALLCGGFVFMSALTFAGLFLLPVVAVVALHDARRGLGRRWRLPLACLVASGAAGWAIGRLGGFDYAVALGAASRLENPAGFLLLADPLRYVMTRLEDLLEIVLFLPAPLAVILTRSRSGANATESSAALLALAGCGSVLLLFAAGAYRTGETARGCLFLVPFLLPLLHSVGSREFRWLIAACATQTAAMQLAGSWFW